MAPLVGLVPTVGCVRSRYRSLSPPAGHIPLVPPVPQFGRLDGHVPCSSQVAWASPPVMIQQSRLRLNSPVGLRAPPRTSNILHPDSIHSPGRYPCPGMAGANEAAAAQYPPYFAPASREDINDSSWAQDVHRISSPPVAEMRSPDHRDSESCHSSPRLGIDERQSEIARAIHIFASSSDHADQSPRSDIPHASGTIPSEASSECNDCTGTPDRQVASPASSICTLPGSPKQVEHCMRLVRTASFEVSQSEISGRVITCSQEQQEDSEADSNAWSIQARDWDELRESLKPHLNAEAWNIIAEKGLPQVKDILVNGSHFSVTAHGEVKDSRMNESVVPMSAIGLRPDSLITGLSLSWSVSGLETINVAIDISQRAGCWPVGPHGQMGTVRLLPVSHRSLHVLLLVWSPPAAMRCMCIEDILKFLSGVAETSSIREMCQQIIVPRTQHLETSYAEAFGTCGAPDIFISHSWDDSVAQLSHALKELKPVLESSFGKEWNLLRVYIGAFTDNLHQAAQDTKEDFADEVFTQVLHAPSCQAFVQVAGRKLRSWSRAWCLLELASAIKAGKQILLSTPAGIIESGNISTEALEHLANRAPLIDIAQSQCHSGEELAKIRELVRVHFGGEESFNALVRSSLSSIIATAIARNRSPKLANIDDISVSNDILGTASSGAIRRGVFKGAPVAVKEIDGVSFDLVADVEADIQPILQLAPHPHVARILAIAIAGPTRAVLAMEIVQGESLQRRLHTSRGPLDVRLVLEGIALGLLHLHSSPIALVHRDLRPANVLLAPDGCSEIAKLVDCGTARLRSLAVSGSSSHCAHTAPQYRAPETFPQVGKRPVFSPQSDVYSYGVVAWQTALRRYPWEDYGAADIRSMVLLGDRSGMPLDELGSSGLSNLIQACWAHKAHQRPEISTLLGRQPTI